MVKRLAAVGICVKSKLEYTLKDFCLGIYEKAVPEEISWDEKLSAVKEVGFSFVEISIDETDLRQQRLDWSKSQRLKILNTTRKIGIPIATMCLSAHRKYPLGSSDKATEERSLEIMEKALGLAGDLGIRIIQLAGYDVYYEESTPETKRRFLKNLQKCVAMASKKGVLMGLETMEVDFMNTAEKAMYYVNEINSPYLNVYPDTGNITNAVDDVTSDILAGRGKTVAAHLKETVPNVFRDRRFGDGHVDFTQAIKAYKCIGVNMFVAEFWHKDGSDWHSELRHAFNFLTEKYNEAVSI